MPLNILDPTPSHIFLSWKHFIWRTTGLFCFCLVFSSSLVLLQLHTHHSGLFCLLCHFFLEYSTSSFLHIEKQYLNWDSFDNKSKAHIVAPVPRLLYNLQFPTWLGKARDLLRDLVHVCRTCFQHVGCLSNDFFRCKFCQIDTCVDLSRSLQRPPMQYFYSEHRESKRNI